MLHHTSISVTNYKNSLAFYDKSFKTLGFERVITIDEGNVQCAGYGENGQPHFWISPMGDQNELIGQARGVHFAFLAPNQAAVDAWHTKCMELGAQDNGAPGPRPEYHPGYYGAFIVDPSGWRIEACIHDYSD